MDITMPDVNGIEATRRILAAKRPPRVIALSMHPDSHMVLEMFHAGARGYLLKCCAFEEMAEAARAVAAGGRWLSPKIADILLADFVRQVPADEATALPGLDAEEREMLQLAYAGTAGEEIEERLDANDGKAALLRQRVVLDVVVPRLLRAARKEQSTALFVSLTEREREILAWMRDGKTTRDIASVLSVSRDTVKYHIKNIFQKTGTNNRVSAVAVALEKKLFDA
jgi:DNA-binding NarL/FixJ family response regulator